MTAFTTDELRVLSMSAPLLLRMLKTREERIIAKIYGEFRSGKTKHLASLAELSCVRDLINEINAQGRNLSAKGATNESAN